MKICDRDDMLGRVLGMGEAWIYETFSKEAIRDFFESDAEVLEWLDTVVGEEVLFTVYIYPEKKVAQYALGIWGLWHGDVRPDFDYRKRKEADYDATVRWLKKEVKQRRESNEYAKKKWRRRRE